MPLSETDAGYVWDMLRHARIVVDLTSGQALDHLLADDAVRLALERAIEIIGEAARGVSSETENAHPEIPWKKIVQQRHVISHEYGAIDYARLWRVATDHVPVLIPQLEAILPSPPPDPESTSENTP